MDVDSGMLLFSPKVCSLIKASESFISLKIAADSKYCWLHIIRAVVFYVQNVFDVTNELFLVLFQFLV